MFYLRFMRKDFKITGWFYELNGFKFRKFLNIVRYHTIQKNPDLMVVMMNPGSSRPVNVDKNYNKETDALPDRTQDQIIRLMNNCSFNYARIINISDLREPKSSVFYDMIDKLENQSIPHSIFDNKRSKEFEELFVKNIPVIFAWGVNKKLLNLAIQAIKRIGDKPIGLKKNGLEYAYYHPLPQNSTKQKEWVEKITEMIKKSS